MDESNKPRDKEKRLQKIDLLLLVYGVPVLIGGIVILVLIILELIS